MDEQSRALRWSRLTAQGLIGLIVSFAGAAEPAKPVSFREQVAPILVRKCLGCHNEQKAESGLNMATFALLRKGGEAGGDLILEPGSPDDSLLIESVRPGAAPRMPYKQPPLSKDEIRTLEEWVRQGARFDGASETDTPIASLVDPLKDLPKVAPKLPVSDPVTSLAYSPDGTTLAAAVGREVVLFDATTGKPSATLGDHPGPLSCVRFTPDGKALVAAGGRAGMFGAAAVWDLETKAKRAELRGHRDAILAADISPDGTTLATAGYDKVALLWDLASGKVLRTLKDHTDAVLAVAFAPDGKTLATAGADRTVKLWEVASGRRLRTLSDATAELYAVAFGPGGRTVLAGGVDRSIHAWRVEANDAPLIRSVFAHDAAILRLVVSRDGTTLASSGEDRDVKLWDLATLEPRRALDEQPDWPQGLAISPDGVRVAVGRYDGSVAVFDEATGKVALSPRGAPPAPPPAKPELVRNATLNPHSPRGAARGTTVRLTLSGRGVGKATALIFPEPGLSGTIVPADKPAADRLDVDLTVAPDARDGLHRIGVVTPLGVPAFQAFAVSALPEMAEVEPNGDPAKVKAVALGATLLGTIDKPGDVDHFRFVAKAGQAVVFRTTAKALGSSLLAALAVLDDEGRTLAEAGVSDGATDPVLTFTAPRDGGYLLRVSDADFAGSGGHFYRIAAGSTPFVTSVFPLGVERGKTAALRVEGLNLQGVGEVSLPVPEEAEAGSLVTAPLVLPDGSRPSASRVVVAEGPQAVEAEDDDDPSRAVAIATPGGASGRIGRDGDVDCFRFEARKGERLVVEVFARRLDSPLDPVIEILDVRGRPIPRAVLRPIDQTETAFRDHTSSQPGIRLTRWNNLAMGDPVLIGRELTRVEMLPPNPDADCQFLAEQGSRAALLETTPEQHPMGQPVYKVEIHPPGASFPPGGVPPVTLSYRNDDGGAGFAKDSRLTFDPPADGAYVVRVEDVRGLGGDGFGYHLVVRRPRPDYRLTVSPENPNVPRGGTALVTARIDRLDGFDGPVDVTIEGLPPGVTATGARIEEGRSSASLALSADASAPAFSPPSWRAVGSVPLNAVGQSTPPPTLTLPREGGGDQTSPSPLAGEGRGGGASDAEDNRGQVPVGEVSNSRAPATKLVRTFDPGGPRSGLITVTPAPNLAIAAAPGRVEIAPGGRASLSLSVARGPAFAGRVPIDVRNLPRGVRVLDVGLNGVLVTEAQRERTVRLYAEPWVEATERPFYAVGKAEAAGTEHSSPPIGLVVRPTAREPTHAGPR